MSMGLFGPENHEPRVPEREPEVIFDRIRHQDVVLGGLRGAFAQGRMPHALILWGPAGIGRMRSAQAVAQMLLCSGDTPPCGVCPSCGRAIRFTHPDLLLITAAVKSDQDDLVHKDLEAYGRDPYHCLRVSSKASIWIERIRELKAESAKARVERGARVAIIRDAERMTQAAAQAALKIIEEPAPGTYLILTCVDPEQLLPTIVSRCQRYRFRALPREFIEGVLAERTELDPPAVTITAALARGSLGRALALSCEDLTGLRDQALALFHVELRDPAEVSEKVGRLGRTWDPDRAETSIDLMMMWLEDLLLLHHGLPEDRVTHMDRVAELRALAARWPVGEIKRRCRILEELQRAYRQNVNLTLATEAALLRLNRLVTDEGPF